MKTRALVGFGFILWVHMMPPKCVSIVLDVPNKSLCSNDARISGKQLRASGIKWRHTISLPLCPHQHVAFIGTSLRWCALQYLPSQLIGNAFRWAFLGCAWVFGIRYHLYSILRRTQKERVPRKQNLIGFARLKLTCLSSGRWSH